MANNRTTGSQYEKLAAKFLAQKGYRILEQNYRIRSGEVDIIAWHNDTLVICEVKYRRSLANGSPFEAVDYRKQRQISKVTAQYLVYRGFGSEVPVRFDVIGISGNGKIDHIENAFEFCYGR